MVTSMSSWLLMHYKLAVKPSALRVYVWRKLRRLGAILLHDSIWILPDLPRTLEQLQWLVAEIQEMEGEAFLWRSDLVLGVQENVLIGQFIEGVDRQYGELLRKLRRKNSDMAEISRQYQQITGQDYFHSDVGKQVRRKLLALKGEKS